MKETPTAELTRSHEAVSAWTPGIPEKRRLARSERNVAEAVASPTVVRDGSMPRSARSPGNPGGLARPWVTTVEERVSTSETGRNPADIPAVVVEPPVSP